MHRRRIGRASVNLLVFLAATLTPTWLFRQYHQFDRVEIPPVRFHSERYPAKVMRLGPLPCDSKDRQLQFLNQTEAWCSDENHLWHTRDGGETWQLLYSGERIDISEFQFVDSEAGWMLKSRELYRTEDGGHSWTEIVTPMKGYAGQLWSFHLDDNGKIGWIAGGLYYPTEAGRCLNTAAGVLDWQPACLYSAIFRTEDAGLSWRRQPTRLRYGRFFSIVFADAGHGWVAGDADVLHTTDGGKTWCPDRFKPSCEDYYELPDMYVTAISFADQKNGLLLFSSGMVAKSSDGGNTWCGLVEPPDPSPCDNCGLSPQYNLHRVYFKDAAHGIALNSRGLIYESFNGGATWRKLAISTTFDAIIPGGKTSAWAVSQSSELFQVSL
jgi:photosystem II stability/assembly factor-like uncharacterized protein